MKKSILMVAILAITVACNTTKKTTTTTPGTLEVIMANEKDLQGTWNLEFMDATHSNGKALKDMFPNKLPSLTFNTSESTVHGNDGCNNLSGAYEVKAGNTIQIGDKLASTLMACMGVDDTAFKQALSKTSHFTITDGKLVFLAHDMVIMKFSKEQSTLEGEWELVKIQTKDKSAKGIDMRFPIKTPTLNFQGDKLGGNTGCNNISTSFTTQANTINISAIAMTRMFCEGVEEHVFTDAINQVKKYRIEQGQLILSSQDDMDLLTFKRK